MRPSTASWARARCCTRRPCRNDGDPNRTETHRGPPRSRTVGGVAESSLGRVESEGQAIRVLIGQRWAMLLLNRSLWRGCIQVVLPSRHPVRVARVSQRVAVASPPERPPVTHRP